MSSPVLRWVGGKRQLRDRILSVIPSYQGSYHEPFIGGATMLMTQTDKQRFASDANAELINFYQQVQSDFEGVFQSFSSFENTEDHYYAIRAWDREPDFLTRCNPVDRAARFLFLNKTCFQGLWRVNNKKGYNNVPYSYPKKINVNVENLSSFSHAVKNVKFTHMDFEQALKNAISGDFVYLDPPYIPISKTASFTGYTINGFDHERLKTACDELTTRGVKFLQSNSDCEMTRELYKTYDLSRVEVKRMVAAKNSSRGDVFELLIKNY